MFDLYYENFEKDHKQAKELYRKINRTDQETLMFYRLIKKNGEAIEGMKLECASKSYFPNAEKMKKLKQYEKEYNEMEKNILSKDGDFFDNEENQYKNKKMRLQMKKNELLDDVNEQLYQADKIVDDVNLILLDNKNKIGNNQYRIKLMDQELVISQEHIANIKKIDFKSQVIYYLTIGFPAVAIVGGIFLKMVLLGKSI